MFSHSHDRGGNTFPGEGVENGFPRGAVLPASVGRGRPR